MKIQLWLALASVSVLAAAEKIPTGPEPGSRIPPFAAADSSGRLRQLADLTGPKGLMLVFFRSADW
jgi:hypothetical protein